MCGTHARQVSWLCAAIDVFSDSRRRLPGWDVHQNQCWHDADACGFDTRKECHSEKVMILVSFCACLCVCVFEACVCINICVCVYVCWHVFFPDCWNNVFFGMCVCVCVLCVCARVCVLCVCVCVCLFY